jgi:hypothetical protein
MEILLLILAIIFLALVVGLVVIWMLITFIEAIFGTDRNSDLL